MTEAEWLTSGNSVGLATYWGERFTERKARLLMLACCLRRRHLLAHPLLDEGIEALTAHYADPTGPDQPFGEGDERTLYTRIHEYTLNDGFPTQDAPESEFLVACALKVAVKSRAMAAEEEETLLWQVQSCLYDAAEGSLTPAAGEREGQAALVRELLGNPFRPVIFSPEWRTDTAIALARQMYESREFSAMPILADALQDAGCDNTDILDHCRGPGPHVRGCWVVDLVLGKE